MMRKAAYCVMALTAGSMALSGCKSQNVSQDVILNADSQVQEAEYTGSVPIRIQTGESASKPEILHFVDVFGQEYEIDINPHIERHTYTMEGFSRDGQRLSYESDAYVSQLGVDVSHHQGEIDWKRVKAAGYEFAFIRLGYRGYQTGKLCLDRCFYQNLQNAQACGMQVGVYFFSQAINVEEAVEEADFVIQKLGEYQLQLPVVYDPESILDAEARTDNISGEQFTKNTIAFCRRIQEAGFTSMIYSNMLWEAYELDLTQLDSYPIWYADYEPLPQTPYHFAFWQYSNTGSVDGIGTDADLNIRLIPKRGF